MDKTIEDRERESTDNSLQVKNPRPEDVASIEAPCPAVPGLKWDLRFAPKRPVTEESYFPQPLTTSLPGLNSIPIVAPRTLPQDFISFQPALLAAVTLSRWPKMAQEFTIFRERPFLVSIFQQYLTQHLTRFAKIGFHLQSPLQ